MFIRGVTAAIIGVIISAATLASTAAATGNSSSWQQPLPDSVQWAAVHPTGVPFVGDALRAAADLNRQRQRAAQARASRDAYRAALLADPRTAAHAMMLRQGWGEAQWTCLDTLWQRESQWDPYAVNARSGAYGIPQSLPAWKMSAMGSDWRSNPLTQISWGLWYIGNTYGSPCNALVHSDNYGYY
jgi:Transglycosylase SLT domain